jgi:hypothetical protein
MSKEEYELKKQEKLKARASFSKGDRKRKAGKKVVGWLIFIVIIALMIWGFTIIVDNYSPQGDNFSQTFPSAGRDHIEIGVGDTLPEGTYNSNPPSSGPHYQNTATTGFYDEPIEDQFVIHNLEHGDIWIAYHPRISKELKDRLKGFSDRYVIVSPRENNDSDISLVSWGHVDSFNFNQDINLDQRINDFILRYDDNGPEKVRTGGGHQVNSFN